MDMRRMSVLFCMVFALLLVGCGKKRHNKDKTNLAFSEIESEQLLSESQIPVLDEEVEDFFDEGSISEFAFVDGDDFDKENEEDFFEQEIEENSFVDWDDQPVQDDLSFKTVQFDLNKSGIREDQKEFIKENVEAAKVAVAEGKTLVIQGHTCEFGPDSYNIALSVNRADIIKKEMIKKGIPENKIKTIGFGKEMPLVWSDKADKVARVKELAPNRRASIVIS